MGNQVYANGREISCKAADGKSICAFPDVCLSPPSPPAGPVPIPYPNTGMASDTTSGSKTVKISKKEVMLKNKSYFKKSNGDEAATKSLGMGVVTHQIQGKVYFNSWSMDVKFEGENVVRHLDLTTHNHMSPPGNTVTWPHVTRMSLVGLPEKPCKKSCVPNEDKRKQLREDLRGGTPSETIREKYRNGGTCAACLKSFAGLAADHIVPMDIIIRMPGFACLSEKDQKQVLNSPENFVGLCKSCNSSKREKLWHKWTEKKKTGEKLKPEVREPARKITNDLIVNLKVKIKKLPCQTG